MSTMFKNNKNVPNYILGKGSVIELKNILSQRELQRSPAVFLIDQFFHDKNAAKIFSVRPEDMIIFVSTEHEPKAEYIDEITDNIKSKLKNNLPSVVIGAGGGTTMDIAKCVSILLTNPGKAEEYQGWDLVRIPAVYKIGIPTISGTGAEATRTAVLTSKKAKLGMNSAYSVFDQIILDPSFLETVPKDQFLYTAMDCWLHDIELLKAPNSQMTKALAEESLKLTREVLLGEMDYEKLMIASYIGGCAMATSWGGHICHPVSYGLSFVLGLRHGMAICAAFNALQEYYPESIKEFKDIFVKFNIELPKNLTRSLVPDKFDEMANVILKNEKPLQNSFGDNWREIFTKEKIKDILVKI